MRDRRILVIGMDDCHACVTFKGTTPSMNFVSKTREFRRDRHLHPTVISCTKAASTMARVFHADQVADGLSDFETEVESEGSMYNESESDDSYISEDDGSMDDSDATASNSDASSIFESDSGDNRDGSRDGASTYGRGRGRGRGRCRGRPGVRRGRGGRGAHSA